MTRSLPVTKLLAPLLLAAAAMLSGADANASACSLSLGEVTAPPAAMGVDLPAFKSAAEGELRIVDVSKLHKTRHVLVSLAVIGAEQAPVGCTVNALLRDAKTGNMLAVIEGKAKAEGSGSESLRREVLRAALHNAVARIPEALQ